MQDFFENSAISGRIEDLDNRKANQPTCVDKLPDEAQDGDQIILRISNNTYEFHFWADGAWRRDTGA